MPRGGFTLSELIVVLAVLGLMTTFTLPKLFMSHKQHQRTAVFKETYAALSQAIFNGVQTGELTNATAVSYLLRTMNSVAQCPNNQLLEGCRTVPMQYDWASRAGLKLHNGSTVSITPIGGWVPGLIEFEIDWNGDEGPNKSNEDIVVLAANTNRQTTMAPYWDKVFRPYEMSGFGAAYVVLFREVLNC